MNPFKASYPIHPHVVNRKWGELIIDPATGKSIYAPLGFILHNGTDFGFRDDNAQPVVEKPVWAIVGGTVPCEITLPALYSNRLGLASIKSHFFRFESWTGHLMLDLIE